MSKLLKQKLEAYNDKRKAKNLAKHRRDKAEINQHIKLLRPLKKETKE